ncbi:MAG: glycosyltransferase, partial [Actinomycetota bacterium]
MSDRRLRIGVDAHVIGRRQTGNERFLTNLVRAIRALSPHELFLYFTEEGAASDWRRRGDERTTVRLVRPRNPFARIPVSLPLRARRDRVDVLLVHYNAPPVAPCPVVTIVHDVAFARYPEYYSRFDRAWMPRTIPASMRRAAAVVTVSRFSRDEICTLYVIPPAKIAVAHDGVDRLFSDRTQRPCPVDPPFFLAFGNLQPRKNLATLLRAFRLLVESNPEIEERLVIAGKPAFGAEEIHATGEDLRR